MVKKICDEGDGYAREREDCRGERENKNILILIKIILKNNKIRIGAICTLKITQNNLIVLKKLLQKCL